MLYQRVILTSLFIVFNFVVAASSRPDTPPIELDDHHSDTYEWFLIEGFWTQIRFPESMDVEELEQYTRTLVRLINQLKKAKALLPADAVAKLQTVTHIFLKDDCSSRGLIGYFRQSEEDGGKSWIALECFDRTSSILMTGVTFDNRIDGNPVWANQTLMIHELAHVWHDRFMADGEDNETIKAFYEHAKRCYSDADDPHYWESDELEFFADFTTMYFLGHWDPPNSVYAMPASYRRLFHRSWTKAECPNCESLLGPCPAS